MPVNLGSVANDGTGDPLRTAFGKVNTDAEAMRLALRDAGVLPLSNVGGTGDAITAQLLPSLHEAGVTTLSAVSQVEYVPVATNTVANPTLTIGGATYPVRNADGGTWPAGGFVVGRSYKLRRRGTILRVTGGDATYADLAAARADRIASVSQMGAPVLVSVAGTGNAVTASVPAAVQATGVLGAGLRAVNLIWPADNAAGAVTLAIDGQPAIEVRDIAGAVPATGALRGGSLTHLVMDATQNWRIASPETRRAEVVAIQSQVAAMRAKEAFAGDPAVVAEDGSGSAVGYFNDAGDLLVPAIIAGRQLAGDDGMRVVSDASGQPLIWADPQQGRLGLAPVDWSSQSFEGFGWDRAFARLHAGDPVVLFEDAGGSAVMWVDEDGRLIGGGGGGGGITRPLPSTSGNAWQVVDDGTSVRYLSDQYQGRVMGFEERGGVILTDSSPIAIGVLAYGGGSASVSRQLIEDWRYNVRQPDLSHSGGMLAAEAAAAASLSLRHARRLATPSMITLTASIGSPVAADTNAASPLFGAAMAEIAQAVISLEDWGKDLVVDRVCLSILGGAPDTLPLTAENEYASVASALRAQIVTATGQAQPPLIVVSPSAGAREGGAMAVSHVEARLDQTHPALGFVVAGPRHAYDLEPDTVGTLSRQGATLMTEMEAIAVREVQGGGLWYCPILISASRSGAVITAQFAALTDLVLDPGGDHGFALVGVTNDAVISSVSIAGRTATITLSEPPTGSLTLHCASGRSGTPTGARPVNRTDIRDQWGEASLQVAGYTHRRRALPAAVTVS